MPSVDDRMLRVIHQQSIERAARLAGDFINVPAEQREAVMAQIDFERWLAEIAVECLR